MKTSITCGSLIEARPMGHGSFTPHSTHHHHHHHQEKWIIWSKSKFSVRNLNPIVLLAFRKCGWLSSPEICVVWWRWWSIYFPIRWRIEKLEARVTDVDLKGVGAHSVTYLAKVNVSNPYCIPIPLGEIRYLLKSSGRSGSIRFLSFNYVIR